VFARGLDLVLASQGREQTCRGAEIGYCQLLAQSEHAGKKSSANLLPADTDIPAPAMTTIRFRLRRAASSLFRVSSLPSVRSSRLTRSVVRGRGGAFTRRRFAFGVASCPGVPAPSTFSKRFMGDAVPEVGALELGEGYRCATSDKLAIHAGGSDGDLENTESGDIGGDALVSSRFRAIVNTICCLIVQTMQERFTDLGRASTRLCKPKGEGVRGLCKVRSC
jgi:hypothetical protein